LKLAAKVQKNFEYLTVMEKRCDKNSLTVVEDIKNYF